MTGPDDLLGPARTRHNCKKQRSYCWICGIECVLFLIVVLVRPNDYFKLYTLLFGVGNHLKKTKWWDDMQTLEVGSAGVDVELWQRFLNRSGYPVGSVDGIFGIDTKAATEAFQKAEKLTADGIVGNATLTAAIGRGFKPIISRGTSPPRAESNVIAEVAGVQVSELASGIAVFYRAGN
jgi:hypothetical protein